MDVHLAIGTESSKAEGFINDAGTLRPLFRVSEAADGTSE